MKPPAYSNWRMHSICFPQPPPFYHKKTVKGVSQPLI
jgi:hypothetical protein